MVLLMFLWITLGTAMGPACSGDGWIRSAWIYVPLPVDEGNLVLLRCGELPPLVLGVVWLLQQTLTLVSLLSPWQSSAMVPGVPGRLR